MYTESVREREPARINSQYLGDNHEGHISSLLLCSSCQKKVPVSTVSLRIDSDTRASIPGGSKDLWEPIKSCSFYPSNRIFPLFPKNAQANLENPSLDLYPLGLKISCLFPHSAQPQGPRLWNLRCLSHLLAGVLPSGLFFFSVY